MQQFGGKDSKRHFTVVMGNKEHGLYVSSTPSSAAKKAVTKLCASNKSKKVQFEIREITQGSKKKTYGPYEGYIEKLKEPIELKGRVIKYKPVAKLSGKVRNKMKGGMDDGMYDLRNIKKSLKQTYNTILDEELMTNDFKEKRGLLMNKLGRITEEEENILNEIQDTILRIEDHPSNPAKNNDLNDLYESRLKQYNEYIEQNPESIVKDYLDMFKRILSKKKDDKIIERRKQKEINNQLERNKKQQIRQIQMEENRRLAEEKAQKNQKEEQIKQNLDSIANNLHEQKKISVKSRYYYNLASSESSEDRHYIIEIQKIQKIQKDDNIYFLCFIQGYYIAYMIRPSKSKNFYGIFIVNQTQHLQEIIGYLSEYFDSMMPSRNWFNKINKNFGMIELFPGEYRNTYYPSDNSKILKDATHLQRL
jgi:hypothetical protein